MPSASQIARWIICSPATFFVWRNSEIVSMRQCNRAMSPCRARRPFESPRSTTDRSPSSRAPVRKAAQDRRWLAIRTGAIESRSGTQNGMDHRLHGVHCRAFRTEKHLGKTLHSRHKLDCASVVHGNQRLFQQKFCATMPLDADSRDRRCHDTLLLQRRDLVLRETAEHVD